ncbi:MAG TPA: transglutaminase domain-containing protein [Thermotogota bacterium]|nr:transglutaminase domain-containing protein [Thermotogota bacterium]
MKKKWVSLLLLAIFVFPFLLGQSPFDDWISAAVEADRGGDFSDALRLYSEVLPYLRDSDDTQTVRKLQNRIFEMQKIQQEFPLDVQLFYEELQRSFPHMEKETMDKILANPRLESVQIDGKTFFFGGLIPNLRYRDRELFRTDHDALVRARLFFLHTRDTALQDDRWGLHPTFANPFTSPTTFLFRSGIHVSRDKLPASGTLQLWFPQPILGASQKDVRLVAIQGEEFLGCTPRFDAELGIAYFEVPLEQLPSDLELSLETLVTSYRQQVAVDAAKVGEYDDQDPDFLRYTASSGAIVFDASLSETARLIVGDETNPYLQAKKIYDYIVQRIAYSDTPHMTLNSLDIEGNLRQPESLYVHRNGFGDTLGQSAYFCALCRSLGIPARTTGGFQWIPSVEGPHYWAEFFLPRYGWVPADPAFAGFVDYFHDYEISASDKKRFQEFYFGGIDPYRMVVQKDLWLPLSPRNRQTVLLPIVLEFPQVNLEGESYSLDVATAIKDGYGYSFLPLSY